MLDRAENPLLPETFARWFAQRGWTPRAHQLELLERARAGRSVLLIAPTGGGKTLAGFLPSLVELSAPARAALAPARGLVSAAREWLGEGGRDTLYTPRLRARAGDSARNIKEPLAERDRP